jgi:hypothetical protein
MKDIKRLIALLVFATIGAFLLHAQQQNFGGTLNYVTALAATCTPGVTASVQLSVTPFTINYCSATNTWTALGAGGGGLSGMTAGQVAIAATASTVTSSKALAGSGAGITTGPASGVTSTDFAAFTGTGGQIADSGIPDTAAGILAACTGCAPLASPTFTGTVTLPLLASTTNCAAAGTGANPSVVSCTAAPAGSFSCATNASTGTCTVDTTAVTANSNIFIQPVGATVIGTKIGVTCNTTSDTGLTAPRLAAQVASTSFTINLGTFSSNPLCFNYWIVD